jgi:hypothetical protein
MVRQGYKKTLASYWLTFWIIPISIQENIPPCKPATSEDQGFLKGGPDSPSFGKRTAKDTKPAKILVFLSGLSGSFALHIDQLLDLEKALLV